MKIAKRLPMVVFTGFIGIMLLLFIILPKEDYSPSEKRYLAELPELTAKSFFSGEFGEKFEKYLSDHTAFRKLYVGINSYYDYLCGNNGKNGYYLSENSYIITDPTKTDKLENNIEILNEFYDTTKTNTYIVIAPSTGYICDDLLPKNHLPYKDDMIFQKIQENLNPEITFVDIREIFKNTYQNSVQLYYRTDHHWTSEGAYTAYTALSEKLNINPYDKKDFEISSISNFYGTTYSSSGFWLIQPDTLEVWDLKTINDVYIKDGSNEITGKSCFFRDNLSTDDQYTVFLDGNHPYTRIKTDKAEIDEKILIIKDSFAHSLTPFLSNHYKDITMIDMRYYKDEVSALVQEENFNKIIYIYSADNFSTDGDLAWLE